MTEQNNSSGKIKKRISGAEILLYLTSIATLFAFLGTRALYGSENRWAEVVREMVQTDDIFHPCLNYVVYFDKPIMSYWLIYLSSQLFGTLNEWTLRIPSALFGLLAIWATVKLFKKLFDEKIGILSGWLLLTSWGFLWWSRSAEADIENMAMIIFAFTWFIHCHKQAGFFHYLVFYLLLFTGALFKGVPAIAVPLAAAGVFTIINGEVRRHLNFSNFFAGAIGVTVFFSIPYLSGTTPLAEGCSYPVEMSAVELMWRENVVRAFSAFDHNNAPYIYLYELPRVLIPWSPLFVLAVAWGIFRWKQLEKEAKALLISIGLIFVLFTVSESRRWYYILPIAPFCAGLTALYLYRGALEKKWMKNILNIIRYAAIAVSSLAILSLLCWSLWDRLLGFSLPTLLLLGVPVVGAIIMVILILDERKRDTLAVLFNLPRDFCAPFLSVAIVMITIFSLILPACDEFRTFKPFLLETKEQFKNISPDKVVLYSHESDCELLYYWDFPTKMTVIEQNGTPVELEEILKEPDEKKREDMRKLNTIRSYTTLRNHLRELSKSDGDILLISFERNMNRLKNCGVSDFPEFDRFSPNVKEPASAFQKQGGRKYWIWQLNAEKLRNLYKNEQEGHNE